jgi:hypothetical protein
MRHLFLSRLSDYIFWMYSREVTGDVGYTAPAASASMHISESSIDGCAFHQPPSCNSKL